MAGKKATGVVEVVHSPLFQYYFDKYRTGRCRVDQLVRLVKLNALTEEEFTEITKLPYKD